MAHYKVGDFKDPAQEVHRLAEQAKLLAEKERAALTAVGLPGRGLGLEVGCGPGFFAQGMADSAGDCGRLMFGVDYDGFVLREARGRLPVVRGDANALPFADASLDFAYGRLFFRHLSRPAAVLADITRIVKPGGVVAAIDSSDSSLLIDPMPAEFPAVAAARRKWFSDRGGRADMGHTLPGLFVSGGLRDVEVRTIVLDTTTLSRPVFAQVVLAAFLQAADSSLAGPQLAAAKGGVDSWVQDPAGYAAIMLFVVGGRRS